MPLALLAIAGVAGGCGGGGGGDTVTVTVPQPATFIVDILDKKTVRPSEIAFSVNRDLVATELRWSGWGKPTASASATFVFDQAPHTSKSSVPGRLVVSQPQRCMGALYYTSTRLQFDEQPPFEPRVPPLSTPCD